MAEIGQKISKRVLTHLIFFLEGTQPGWKVTEIPGGGGLKQKGPSVGGGWIFSGTTHCIASHADVLRSSSHVPVPRMTNPQERLRGRLHGVAWDQAPQWELKAKNKQRPAELNNIVNKIQF